MAGQEQISLQRRLGLRFLQFLIVLLAFALVRNCIIISTNRNIPRLKMEQEYYEKGVDAGKQKALNSSLQAQPHFPDLLLEQRNTGKVLEKAGINQDKTRNNRFTSRVDDDSNFII